MRFVPTLVHGIADYVVGAVMILLAFVADIGGIGFYAFLILGAFAILYALVTDYELGWKPLLSIPAHLALDAVFALVMLVLPLILVLPTLLFWASIVIGVMAATLVVTTRMR
ncbi:hypothetical protein [Rhizobium halophilum]|uniref:hypothetical protein n=1 Tax=Rhizobium halophilum TaxID=2846852 RepID=UPI001EFE6980|nr:hypothetical protein [Rhizobium halophilum]MCF6370117.1 hypothetical protein [Rhizobium halophilum]